MSLFPISYEFQLFPVKLSIWDEIENKWSLSLNYIQYCKFKNYDQVTEVAEYMVEFR